MQKTTILMLGLALLAYASMRPSDRTKPSGFRQLKGWQKIFGVVAIILTLLIILNPEFIALGLIGDTALFDMLVLALSLRLHMVATRAFQSCFGVLSRSAAWLGIPSPGLRYLLSLLIPLIAGATNAFHKALHRILS